MKYLDPKNDLTFKKIFGEHPKLLKSFLNAMLPLNAEQEIESLEYLTAEMVPDIPLMKDTIVDVRCKDKQGRQFIVEMQMNWTTGFMQRVLFNASKAYVRQLDKNENYKILQPVYALNLVNENYNDSKNFYHHYQIVEAGNSKEKIEGLEFVFVELQKFEAKNISDKKLQVLWLRFLTEINEKTIEVPQDLLETAEIREAAEKLEANSFTKSQLEYYDRYWDKVRRERTLKEESFDKGKAEGKAEERRKMAKKLKNNGIDINIISDTTGLTIKEIKKI